MVTALLQILYTGVVVGAESVSLRSEVRALNFETVATKFSGAEATLMAGLLTLVSDLRDASWQKYETRDSVTNKFVTNDCSHDHDTHNTVIYVKYVVLAALHTKTS